MTDSGSRPTAAASNAELEPDASLAQGPDEVRHIPDRLAHQPALDGLRALAVLAVLVYHNSADDSITGWAIGGSLGVDIFFVLSGFLITSLLLIHRAKHGKTVSRQFWARRLRRLVPALLVLIVLVSFYSLLVAQPTELSAIRSQGFATLFYVQNWYVIFGHTGETPLVHTWSLAIEEQWYLIWPLLLGAILVVSRGRYSRSFLAILALVGASALCMAVLYQPIIYSRAYNGTDSRAFELLIGAGLAVLLLGRRIEPTGWMRHALELAGIAGILFLGWAILNTTPGDAWMYRGGYLLVAIATAAVIMASTQSSSAVLGPVLSWLPLTAIGLISYGLYLFHVPVFEWLTPERVGAEGAELFVVRLVAVFAIAALSYFLVEMPIRRGRLTGARAKVIVPVAIVGTIALFVVATDGATNVSASALQRQNFADMAKAAPSGTTRVLVAGDASAYNLAASVGGMFKGEGTSGVAIASFCGLLPGRVVVDSVVRGDPCPATWIANFTAATQAFRPKVAVIMVGTNEVFDRRINGTLLRAGTPALASIFLFHLEEARRALTAGGAKLVVLGMPCLDSTTGAATDVAAVQGDPARRAWVNSVLESFAASHGARYADLGTVLCPGGSAPAQPSDGAQLSPASALAVWRWLAPIVKHPEPVP